MNADAMNVIIFSAVIYSVRTIATIAMIPVVLTRRRIFFFGVKAPPISAYTRKNGRVSPSVFHNSVGEADSFTCPKDRFHMAVRHYFTERQRARFHGPYSSTSVS